MLKIALLGIKSLYSKKSSLNQDMTIYSNHLPHLITQDLQSIEKEKHPNLHPWSHLKLQQVIIQIALKEAHKTELNNNKCITIIHKSINN